MINERKDSGSRSLMVMGMCGRRGLRGKRGKRRILGIYLWPTLNYTKLR